MGADEVALGERFRSAVKAAFATGDRELVYALFADDVEYTTPHRTLRGLSEVREKLKWGGEKDNVDVELDEGDWRDLGDGKVASETCMVQRWKETGEVAAMMTVREQLTVRDGKIVRYERRAAPQ
jgi:ketosteroid isomerase-like protein